MKKYYHTNKITIVHGSHILKGFIFIIVLLLFVFSLSGLLTSIKPEYRPASQSVNDATSAFTGKMLFSLLAFDNQYFAASITDDEKTDSIGKQLLKLSANISLEDPRSLLGRELPGFSIFDSEILVAGEGTDYTNMPYESSPPNDMIPADSETTVQNIEDVKIEDEKESPNSSGLKTDGKVVYIYHSHNTESFTPYLKNLKNIDSAHHSKINITKVGEKLQKSLENQGIGSIVESSDIQGNLKKKGLKYKHSYKESRIVVSEALTTNKDFYLIDIHRDSKRKKHTTTTIDGKSYAKLAFVIGGKNAKYKKNADLAKKLHQAIEKKYPGLSRGVILKNEDTSNSIYNQDLSEQSMLVEVGGVDNTFEEMYRSMNAFADIFGTYYWNENNAKEASISTESVTN